MIAVLLSTLFAAAAVLAVGALAQAWQRYGAAALAVHDQLRACPETRELRYAVREWPVRPAVASPVGATIIRADFKRRVWAAVSRSGQRAAA